MNVICTQVNDSLKSFKNQLFTENSLPSGTDLNDVVAAGIYGISGTYSYTNCPYNYGVLFVIGPSMSSTANIKCQLMFTSGQSFGRVYIRYYGANGFASFPWYRIDGVNAGS